MADITNSQQPPVQSKPQYILTHPRDVYSAGASRPISKWWFISMFICSAIFFVIAGALLGSMQSDSSYSYVSYYYGNIACFVLASACKFVAWILVTVYCVQRRKYLSTNSSLPISQPGYVVVTAPSPNNPRQQPPNYGVPAAGFINPQPPTMGTFCGRCGASVTTAFCTQCGAVVSGGPTK